MTAHVWRVFLCAALVYLTCEWCPFAECATDFAPAEWGPIRIMNGQNALVPVVSEVLLSGSAIDRQRAAFILGQVGTPAAIEALRVAVSSDSARMVRIHAGIALALNGERGTTNQCEAGLYSGESWLQYYAVSGLRTTWTTEARTLLMNNRCEGDPFIGRVIARALELSEVGAPSSPPVTNILMISDWEDAKNLAIEALMAEADVWFHGGDYEQVVRTNEAAIFIDPQWMDPYANNGWLQWSMGRQGAAIRTYRRAIAAMPENWEAHYELGFYYFLKKAPTLALRHLKRGCELGAPPVPARAYAHALERTGQLEASLAFWRELDARDASGTVDQNIARIEAALRTR